MSWGGSENATYEKVRYKVFILTRRDVCKVVQHLCLELKLKPSVKSAINGSRRFGIHVEAR